MARHSLTLAYVTALGEVVKECGRCRELLPASSYNKHAGKPDGLQPFCRCCDRKAVADNDEKKRQRRGGYIKSRGGACQLCGQEHLPTILHLHHVDPSTKTRSLTVSCWTGGPRGKDAAREADTCAVLCPTCHALEHHALRNGASLIPTLETPSGHKPVIPVKRIKK